MKKPALSILTIAVIFAPLTALAHRIQRHTAPSPTQETQAIDSDSEINHNAYGVPLNPDGE